MVPRKCNNLEVKDKTQTQTVPKERRTVIKRPMESTRRRHLVSKVPEAEKNRRTTRTRMYARCYYGLLDVDERKVQLSPIKRIKTSMQLGKDHRLINRLCLMITNNEGITDHS